MMHSCCLRSITLSVLILVMSGCNIRGVQNLKGLRSTNVESDLANYYTELPHPQAPMNLNAIIAFALHRNLDVLVQRRELDIQKEMVQSEKLKMLPSLTLSGELSGRDRDRAKAFSPLPAGPETVGTISEERITKQADLALVWSILDFGLSYYNAQREVKREQILSFQYKRARQNLILDIIKAYWRAIVARQAAETSVDLINLAQTNQKKLKEQVERRIVSEMHGLESENQLIEIQIKLHHFKNEYKKSKAELAALMGLPPELPFEIAPAQLLTIDNITYDIRELEDKALRYRPELYAQDIEGDILEGEIQSAMLQMFPDLNLFTKHNFDDDRFLINQHWFSAGVRTSWNLLSIPSLMQKKTSLESKQEFLEQSRLALSIGILTQLHLADIEYKEAIAQYHLSNELLTVKDRLLNAAKKEYMQGLLDDVDIFNYRVEALFAKINTMKSYAVLHVALEKMSNSLGDPLHFYPQKDKIHLLISEYNRVLEPNI